MLIGSGIGSSGIKSQPPVKFGAIYRITENSQQEVAEASKKLQDAGMFISRFFQGEDKYLAANEKRGRSGREPGQDASAVAGAFKIRHSSPRAFTRILERIILKKKDQGAIKNLAEVDQHPALVQQKSSAVLPKAGSASTGKKQENPFKQAGIQDSVNPES